MSTTEYTSHLNLDALAEIYRDFHRNPELSFQETRTAGIVAQRLEALGWDVTTGVGQTGVVAVLRNGDGPTALLRADMDALPVAEDTGLDYSSSVRSTDPDGRDVPVMHACGHDMHTTCLLGAAEQLAADRDSWQGTAMLVFQPAEELGTGASGMIDDGLFERFGRPDVVLGQHVAPAPVGIIGYHPGVAFAGSDSIKIVLYGSGGHGSRPEATIDPIVMAASVVMKLQTIVSREIPAAEQAVVTVGLLHAGTKNNIIPSEAELQLSIRSFNEDVRHKVLASVERIVNAEAEAAGATRKPDIINFEAFPPVVNDSGDASERVLAGFRDDLGLLVIDPGPVTGSEDVGMFATAAGVPCVYWVLGGADPEEFSGLTSIDDMRRVLDSLPSNHSPKYAPVIEPTLSNGIAALVSAAHSWMPPAG